MQQAAQLVSVDEYLCTSYEGPDREYVDGVIMERNLGELPDTLTQLVLMEFFLPFRPAGELYVYQEQRLQVNETRFRVPDTCVYLTRRKEKIFSAPPFLVIEVLSKDDRMSEMQERIDDYIAFGVPYVWVIDPLRKRGYVYTANGASEAKDGVLRTADPDIAFSLGSLVEIARKSVESKRPSA